MGDAMDQIQLHEQEERERHIRNARQTVVASASFTCEACDAPIPQARRLAVAGVTHCVECQQKREQQGKHYRRPL